MRVFEPKEVLRVERVLKTIKCDVCESDIKKTDIDFYYEVMTLHNRWGNDSIETHENFEFCSWDCLTKHQGKYFTDAENTSEYQIVLTEKDRFMRNN